MSKNRKKTPGKITVGKLKGIREVEKKRQK
jgi:hypothetical protein